MNKEIINPLKNKTEYGWHFEQNVYDPKGLIRSIKSGGGSGNIPKVIIYENKNKTSDKTRLYRNGE